MPIPERRLQRTLRTVFGLQALRPGQRQVIERVLGGRSTLAVMPTGAGKSLCYQLPALLLEGCTVVVSPLIALMKDQCEKLQSLGIAAVQFNSHVEADEIHAGEQAVRDGSARLVFATPERLADAEFSALLRGRRIALLVVDEAHCISQWGHDFRPAFLGIGTVAKEIGDPPVLALTATANSEVAADIMEKLGIPRAGWIDTGTYRPNLHFAVEQHAREDERLRRTLALVGAAKGSGIVYTATVKAAEAVYEALRSEGESVGLYHGRRSASERREAQDAFMADRLRVMVATNAFGMGIDKADIRFVLHYQMPSGLDAYYQEAGRAGRDGAPSACTLLFLRRDRALQQFFLTGRYPTEEELDALLQALEREPAQASGQPLADLKDRTGLPQNKLKAAVSVLRNRRIVGLDREGRVRLLRADLAADQVHELLAAYRRKREQDHATLERIVFYAQSGQCRWQVLLAYLEEEAPPERCGNCDNCRRIAQHEAAMAAADAAADSDAPKLRHPARPRLPPPAFVARQPVRVKRYGEGSVVSADALSITIEFADGSRRCFQPEFVQPIGGRKSAGRASRAGAGTG